MKISSVVCGVNQLDTNSPRCPICNKPGKKIMPQTLKNMLKGDRLPSTLRLAKRCFMKS